MASRESRDDDPDPVPNDNFDPSYSNASKDEMWECWICKQKLSRRQRLQSHLHVIHGLTEYQCKKRYKLYTRDDEIPVPRMTQWRQTQGDTSQISNSSENINQHFTDVETVSSESSSENESSDNETAYDDTPTCINDIESDDDNVCYNSVPVANVDVPTAVKLTDLEEKCLSIWAYVIKHRLTTLALNDALTLFPLVSGVDTTAIKLKDMNSFLENVDIKIHDVCETCGTLYPDDENIFSCSTSQCRSLRYKGSTDSQYKRNHKNYFATLSVEQQLIEIMSRPEMWEKMESYMHTTQQNNTIITDIHDGEAYKHVLMSNKDARHTFTLSMNTDGALLYSSSHVDLWPVFLVINELPPKLRYSRINMITWGLWQTATKPNFSTYLIPLCQELISLKANGFDLVLPSGVKTCKAVLIMAIVDLMAKAPLLGMAYHNGSYGCSSCEEPGKVVKSGKGTVRSYPPRDAYTLRNTSSFAATANKVITTGTEELGIRNLSPLLSLDYFDIVNGVVPDYMHGILLGITKKLITLWTKSKYSKQRFYIGNKVHVLEDRLHDMMPNDYIQRMPRKFKHSWKASEYQVWLLYFGLPCLDGILPSEYYDHFSMFVSAIYKLLSDTISEADLKCAEQELQEFYMRMPVLYGFEQCGLNVHNAGAHLCSYVRMWGPLWAWSCFSYEDMNGNVLSRVHGTGDVTVKSLQMLQMQKILRTTYPSMRNIQLRSFVAETLRSSQMPRKLREVDLCSIAGGLQKSTVPQSILDQLKCHIPGAETSSFLKALRVLKSGHVFFGSEYSRMEKHVCNIVLITDDSVPVIGAIKYFLLHKDSGKCFAVYTVMEVADTKPFLTEKACHLIRLKESGSIDYAIPISKVTEKLMLGSLSSVKSDDSTASTPKPPDTSDNGSPPLLQRMAIIQKDGHGYGLTVSGDNPVYVASVKPDGAAARAGVQTGDRIIKVNGKLVTNSHHTEVVKLIKSGSYVALTLLGKPSATQTDRDSVVEHRERGDSSGNSRDSVRDSITAPLPVDAEKEKDLHQQKKNTIRAMFEHAQDEYDSLKKAYKSNPSEKAFSLLQDKEKTLRILEAQLHERPVSHVRDSQITTLAEADPGSSTESNVTGWLPKKQRKHTKHSSSPGAMYRPSEGAQARTGSGVFRSKSDVSGRKPSDFPAFGGDSTDAERGSSLRRKFGKQKKLLQKTVSVPAVSDITSISDSPFISPSASPTPVHYRNQDHDHNPDSGIEDGSLSSVGMSSSLTRPTTQIIGMDDDEFASEDESQEPDRRSRPVSQFLAKLQNLETGDSKVFADLRVLDAKPAHMAIFLHYVFMHHNPAPLLFYQLSGIYSQAPGSVKDLKKWAYEIHSTFLVQQAPLRVSIDDTTLDQIDQNLVRPDLREETLRGLFHKARLIATEEVRKLLEDLRQKKEQGLIEGSSELKDQMDRTEELRIVDKYLLPDLEKCVQHGEDDDKFSAQGWAIATFLRQVGPSKQSQHSVLERVQSFIAKEKRSSKSKKSTRGHQFILQHFVKQEFCLHCKTVLWGVGFQGYQCQACELCVHKHCIDVVEEACNKKKKRPITVFKPKLSAPVNHNCPNDGDKDFTSPTNPNQPHVQPQPYKHPEDKEKSALHDRAHTVNNLVNRYDQINTNTSPEPESTAGGKFMQHYPRPLSEFSPRHTRKNAIHKSPRKGTDLGRSESVKGRADQKSDRPTTTRRSKSDVDVDPSMLNMISTTRSSSPSSLSNRSGESPSESMDSLTSQIQDDSDFDVEPELPSLKQVLGEDTVRKLKPKEKKRQDVINELFYTEKSHVRSLKILEKLFYRPMLKESSIISPEFTKSLFPNLETMTALHKSLNNSMKARRKEKSVIATVGDILLQRFDGEAGENFRNGCAIFCRNQTHSLETLKVRMRKDAKLAQLVSDAENNPLLQRLALKDIIPRQFMRLTKYPLLIENLMRHTPTNTEEHSNLQRAQECSKHILDYVNQAVKDCENHQRLIDLQRRIDKKMTDVDNSPEMDELKTFDLSRHKLVHDGALTWRINNSKSIKLHVVLLEQAMVLLQKQEERLVMRLQSTLLVSGKDDSKRHSPLLWLNNILARNDASNSKAFFVVNTSKTGPQIYQLVADTELEQRKWTKMITQASETQKKQEISMKKKIPVSTAEITSQQLVDQHAHEALPEQVEVSPLPDLVHPDDVDVNDLYSSTDIHVISPLEKLRHNTENLDAVLEERQSLIAELLNVTPAELPDKVKDLEDETQVPQELIVMCHHQTSQLFDLVKEGPDILQEKAHDSGELVDSLDDVQLPIPMDRLRDMASRMNHILTNLLAQRNATTAAGSQAAVNSQDEEHDRLRRELKLAQDELNRLRRIQQAAAPLLENQATVGRPASLVSSESGDENHDELEQAGDIEIKEDGMPGIPIVLEPEPETESLNEVSPVIEETLPDLEEEKVVCEVKELEGEEVTECLEADIETVEETLHEVEPPDEDELEDLETPAIQLVGEVFDIYAGNDGEGIQTVNIVLSSDVDGVNSRLSGDEESGEQTESGREHCESPEIFHDSTDGVVAAGTVMDSGGGTGVGAEIRTCDAEIDDVNMQNNTSDISKDSVNVSNCTTDSSSDSNTIEDSSIVKSTDKDSDATETSGETDTSVTDLITPSAEQV